MKLKRLIDDVTFKRMKTKYVKRVYRLTPSQDKKIKNKVINGVKVSSENEFVRQAIDLAPVANPRT